MFELLVASYIGQCPSMLQGSHVQMAGVTGPEFVEVSAFGNENAFNQASKLVLRLCFFLGMWKKQ